MTGSITLASHDRQALLEAAGALALRGRSRPDLGHVLRVFAELARCEALTWRRFDQRQQTWLVAADEPGHSGGYDDCKEALPGHSLRQLGVPHVNCINDVTQPSRWHLAAVCSDYSKPHEFMPRRLSL